MKDKKYLFGLDLIRFAAALGVTVFHVGFSCWAATDSGARHILKGAYTIPEITPFAWLWWMGVDTFFVISGFVIAQSAAGATPLQFLKGRILRLYPAVWICAPITCALKMALDLRPDGALVKTLAFSAALFPSGPWIDGQYWTLGVEIVFYSLIFALLAFGRWRNVTTLAMMLAVWSFAYLALLNVHAKGVFSLPALEMLAHGKYRLSLAGYGCCFAVGVFIWLWSVGKLNGLARIGAGIAVSGGVMQIFWKCTADLVDRIPVIDTAKYWFVPAAVWLLSCAAIAISVKWQPKLSPSLQKAIRRIGLMTYPLYLIHFAVGVWLMVEAVSVGMKPLVALAVVTALLIGVSFVISTWLEPLVRQILRAAIEALGRRFTRYTAQSSSAETVPVQVRR